jgi:CxxC-x17-CxxC domain-containing protein
MSVKKNCTKCNEEFLVIDQEEAFYKEKGFPFPEMCPKHRREARLSRRHERELYGYNCDKCSKDIVVAFNPPEQMTIYCKTCYQQYMEGNDCILGYSEGFKAQAGGVPSE